MPFFHAEPLFEQKQVVLKQKQLLLEAKKRHKNHISVNFEVTKRFFRDRQAARIYLPASISQ